MENKKIVRIFVKNHYDKKDDLVSRTLYRAFSKLSKNNNIALVKEGGLYLYGYLENNHLYELITSEEMFNIKNEQMEEVKTNDYLNLLKSLSNEDKFKICLLINKIVFGKKDIIDFMEISTMEENAYDRSLLFFEYCKGLTMINPYSKSYLTNYDDLEMIKCKR